jgi:heptosyltransferase-1
MKNCIHSILIVKTSSLGDIVQAFDVLPELKMHFPDAQIDWAVEAPFASIVKAHPLISRPIVLNTKKGKEFFAGIKLLRKEKYDLIFDLQGNCKSGLITWASRGKVIVGYGFRSVREWPNVLSTNVRFNISKAINIRLFYTGLIQAYCGSSLNKVSVNPRFSIEGKERIKIEEILQRTGPFQKIMVCLGSKWANKQLKLETLIEFLQKIDAQMEAAFLFVWGNEEEKAAVESIAGNLKRGIVVDKLALPTWQNLMDEVDQIIAVDSSALHFAATTNTPSFSIFGPTSATVFKPPGEKHTFIQGKCPYGKVFEKQCPLLRTCPTGACIKDLTSDMLFDSFFKLVEIKKD